MYKNNGKKQHSNNNEQVHNKPSLYNNKLSNEQTIKTINQKWTKNKLIASKNKQKWNEQQKISKTQRKQKWLEKRTLSKIKM